jgi:hypothetical protein
MSTTPKSRGQQAKPTRAEVKAAWGRLRTAADQGSVQASALLIALVENRPLIATTETLTA